MCCLQLAFIFFLSSEHNTVRAAGNDGGALSAIFSLHSEERFVRT